MRNIVFIVYNMIPYASAWGGCQRMYYLAQKLIEKGDLVKVFALNTGMYNTYGRELLPNVEHIEKPQTTRVKETTQGDSSIRDVKSLRAIYHKSDSLLFNEIIPGTGVKAFKKCRNGEDKIVQDLKENQYDLAIISAPPFCVFSYINLVKKISPATKVIMDYRDPWNSWHTGNPLTTSREKHLQKKADLIVCTTDALCDDMSAKFHLPRNKYYTISNGYMGNIIKKEDGSDKLPKGKLNIVYTGTINFGQYCEPYRDSKNLLKAIKQLTESGVDDFCFTFVGVADVNDPELKRIKDELGEKINFVGVVSSAEANGYVAGADIALVMHTAEDDSGRFLVSGKLYDYIHQQKFVLSIGKENGQHALILKENNIGINAVNTVNSIKDAILKCMDLWKNDGLKGEFEKLDVRVFSRAYQIEKYCRVIEKL